MRLAGDRTVGRLIKWLRMLGIPCELLEAKKKEEIPEGVLLLTRASSLASERTILLPYEKPADQLRYLFEKLPSLWQEIHPFSLCLLCNKRLSETTREEVFGLVPDHVYETQVRFRRCPSCGRIYWPGSHHTLMKRRLEEILGRPLGDDQGELEDKS